MIFFKNTVLDKDGKIIEKVSLMIPEYRLTKQDVNYYCNNISYWLAIIGIGFVTAFISIGFFISFLFQERKKKKQKNTSD